MNGQLNNARDTRMTTATPSSAPDGAPLGSASSFRGDFAWTFSGNAMYAAGQWSILSLFAKLGGAAVLGEYALAIAVTAPVGMLAHLNLRSVLATDTKGRYSFGDYLAVRLAVSAVGMVAIAGLAAAVAGNWTLAATMAAAGLGQTSETVSDTCYGAMQRRNRMREVALSMILRTLASVAAMGAALWVTGNLLWAVGALAAGRIAVLVLFDLPRGIQGESLRRSDPAAGFAIARTALPLGLILMLVSLITNLPRYAIEAHLGAVSLAGFTAVVSFITIGSTMVNALGQSATARLSRLIDERRIAAFGRLTGKFLLLVLGLGLAGVAVAAVLGTFVLGLLYRPEFAQHQPLLVAAMAVGTLSYVAIALGYAVTSARVFGAQLPLFAASALGCGVASWLLVPRIGLYGGVLALAFAALLQITGQLWLLRRALRGKAQPV